MSTDPAVVLSALSFAWPDGTAVFRDVSATFGSGRSGLTGDNGAGKTTLLKLIAARLAPTAGSIDVAGQVGYLPQHLVLDTSATVADLLGVRRQLDALRAIESGDASARHFDAVGDQWDIEARARASLDGVGLAGIGLARTVATLSGGETILTALTGLRLSSAGVVLLDEPTNDLDRESRHRLYDAILAWRGALIVVSHDVTLLDLMDETAELRSESLTVFGGPYSAYREHLEQQQAAAQQALRTAEQKVKTEQRQRIEAETKLARRRSYARADSDKKRKPKMIMNQRKTEAQVSAGKLRGELDGRVAAARMAVEEQAARVRRDVRLRIELPDPGVAAGRRLAELDDRRSAPVVVQGPQRVALTGSNGIGKTRLLEELVYPDGHRAGSVRAVGHTDRIGYLPQRLDHLDDDVDVLTATGAVAPLAAPGEVRAGLARFLFRGAAVERRIGDLSGGERFRVALAQLLLAQPPNQLLVLDEPTNSLDLSSVDELVEALIAYRGGLIVVSHDDVFLDRLRIDTWLALDASGLHPGGPQLR